MQAAVAALEAQLAVQGREFLIDDWPGPGEARIRFLGRFQGQPVVWKARLCALAADDAGPQYLDIGPAEADGVPLEIGLAIPVIDEAAMRKTVIMVRNYRRLRPGRHEFAGPRKPPSC
ncbi:hypothetical protein [Thiohalobacter sp.]|uniref:hypothetical protein n=1 Tax=Thiohalobacter sp. TaxID=2025948 RepID=UPI00261E7E0A|nr:hypothetical protein [Thiohalobacter sp.]